MSQGRSRGKAKGVEEFRPYVTRALPVGARINCADNTGAKVLEIIMVQKIYCKVCSVRKLNSICLKDFIFEF